MLDAFFNATIQRIDTPSGASTAGDPAFTTGPAIAARCVLDDPTRAQVFYWGNIMANVSSVLYTTAGELPGGAAVSPQTLMLVMLDEEDAGQIYQVIHVVHQVKDSISHFEIFLKLGIGG